MSISEIYCRLSCDDRPLEKETDCSFALRITFFVLGLLAILTPFLAYANVPGFNVLEESATWSLFAAGCTLSLLNIALQCVQKEKPLVNVDPNPPDEGSFLDIIDHEPTGKLQEIIPTNSPLWKARNQTNCFDNLSSDLLIYMSSFLKMKDVVNNTLISKKFVSIMRSKYIWATFLAHPNYRIWGATNWNFTHTKEKGYHYQETEIIPQNDPFTQLQTYHTLTKIGLHRNFIYLARLMPGGPIAFQNILQLDLRKEARLLTPADLPQHILCGKDILGRQFFALNLFDKEMITLVFVDEAGWCQVANPFWKENQLKFDYLEVLNYILALLKGDDLSYQNDLSPLFLKSVTFPKHRKV